MSVELAKALLGRSRFAEFLGVTVAEIERERSVLAMPLRPELLNAGNILSGGASASLLQVAGAVAAWTGTDSAAEPSSGCVDLSLRYLDAAAGEDVAAEAQTLRRGRDISFHEVRVRSTSGKLICQGLVVHRASAGRGGPPRVHREPRLLPAPSPERPPEDPWLFRGYVRNLSISPRHQVPGTVRLHMPFAGLHADEHGRLDAGALASFVDIAGVAACWSLIPRRQGARGSTIGMHVNYAELAAEPVLADAHVQHRSEEILFSTVHVTSEASGRLVAIGEVSYRLVEPR